MNSTIRIKAQENILSTDDEVQNVPVDEIRAKPEVKEVMAFLNQANVATLASIFNFGAPFPSKSRSLQKIPNQKASENKTQSTNQGASKSNKNQGKSILHSGKDQSSMLSQNKRKRKC